MECLRRSKVEYLAKCQPPQYHTTKIPFPTPTEDEDLAQLIEYKTKMHENSKGIDPERLKSFVRHVCVIAKKHKDRGKARVELQKQMQRLKRFSSKKKEMDEELKELNRKISLVLEKEMQLLGIEQGESAASRELMRNVAENKERIRQINESINELKEKLENYIRFKTERERSINELEEKIRTKTEKKKRISLLKSKLRNLEILYNKLKNEGVDVSRIENKIEDLRLRLSFA